MYMYEKRWFPIVIMVIVGCGIMAYIDAILQPGYWMKSRIKIVVFLLIPFLCFRKNKNFYNLWMINKNGFWQSLGLGAVIYILILGGYLSNLPVKPLALAMGCVKFS